MSDPTAWPLFWVTLAEATGTVAATGLALFLALRGWANARRRAEEAEKLRLQSQALVLHPGPGVMWWLAREHEPAVTISHVVRMRLRPGDEGMQQKPSMFFKKPEELSVGTWHGVGVGLETGDYLEVHWTEEGSDEPWSNGVRIGDPNSEHYIGKAQRGH